MVGIALPQGVTNDTASDLNVDAFDLIAVDMPLPSGLSATITPRSSPKGHICQRSEDALMKVFISSVVRGFEQFRAAAKDAVETLDMKPVMSEHFGARTYSS